MYHFIYITNLPSFYKINLFNRIAEQRRILVVFTRSGSLERNADFYAGEKRFKFISLGGHNLFSRLVKTAQILFRNRYGQLILGGLDSAELWIGAFLSPKRRNAIVIESSIYESRVTGLKGGVKRLFMKRVSTAYVSGKAQLDLALALGFRGLAKITGGVGVFNIQDPPAFEEKTEVRNFLYVGRLAPEKNLGQLIRVFNDLPDLLLDIIGFGPLESRLRAMAGRNIRFRGAVDNRDLPSFYRSADVFVLPSVSEPWGLVVEEAMNNGLPVIVSNRVGCVPEIVKAGENGIVFRLEEEDGLRKAVLRMTDADFCNALRKNVCRMDFRAVAEAQVKYYL